MRWRLITLVLLALLSLGAIAYAMEWLQREKNTVTVTQTVLAGDPTAAEGLSLQWHVGTDMPSLRWDICYQVGTSSYESVFSPHGSNNYIVSSSYPGYPMEYSAFPHPRHLSQSGSTDEPTSLGFTFYYNSFALKKDRDFITRPLKAMLARMEPDQKTYRETVRLSDYYDTYYLAGDWGSLTNRDGTNEAVFQAFFSIPVPKDLLLDITLLRESGYSLGATFNNLPTDGPRLWGIVVEDTVYFYFLPVEGGLDTSRLPEGFGIYAAPYRQYKTPNIDATALSLIYPLHPQDNIEYFRISEDKAHILLMTRRENIQTITLLQREDMAPIGQIELPPDTPLLRGIYQVPEDCNGYLAVFEDDSFLLLVPDAQGTLSARIQGHFSPGEDNLPEDLENQLSLEEWLPGEHRPLQSRQYLLSAAVYDGARLAVLRKDTSSDQSLYLQVFDAGGQIYMGRYDSSLTAFSYTDQEYLHLETDERAHESLSQNYRLSWQELSP